MFASLSWNSAERIGITMLRLYSENDRHFCCSSVVCEVLQQGEQVECRLS